MKDFTEKLHHEFWSRLAHVRAGMLHTHEDRVLPMSHYGDDDESAIWFITAQGTDAHQAGVGGKSLHYVIADASAGIYARVHGRLAVVEDPKKLDELWSPVAAAWFDDGREDRDVRLLRLTPDKAEVWLTDGGAGFLYEIAKANLTDAKPDAGDHGVITF